MPPLPFSKNGIKGKRTLPAPRHASNNHHFIPWHFHIDILQIMGSSPFYYYLFLKIFLHFFLALHSFMRRRVITLSITTKRHPTMLIGGQYDFRSILNYFQY